MTRTKVEIEKDIAKLQEELKATVKEEARKDAQEELYFIFKVLANPLEVGLFSSGEYNRNLAFAHAKLTLFCKLRGMHPQHYISGMELGNIPKNSSEAIFGYSQAITELKVIAYMTKHGLTKDLSDIYHRCIERISMLDRCIPNHLRNV